MTITETDRIVSPKALSARTSLSRTTIWRMIKKRQFPAPIQLSDNRIGWPESAIREWIASKVAQAAI